MVVVMCVALTFAMACKTPTAKQTGDAAKAAVLIHAAFDSGFTAERAQAVKDTITKFLFDSVTDDVDGSIRGLMVVALEAAFKANIITLRDYALAQSLVTILDGYFDSDKILFDVADFKTIVDGFVSGLDVIIGTGTGNASATSQVGWE